MEIFSFNIVFHLTRSGQIFLGAKQNDWFFKSRCDGFCIPETRWTWNLGYGELVFQKEQPGCRAASIYKMH